MLKATVSSTLGRSRLCNRPAPGLTPNTRATARTKSTSPTPPATPTTRCPTGFTSTSSTSTTATVLSSATSRATNSQSSPTAFTTSTSRAAMPAPTRQLSLTTRLASATGCGRSPWMRTRIPSSPIPTSTMPRRHTSIGTRAGQAANGAAHGCSMAATPSTRTGTAPSAATAAVWL